MKKFEVSLNDFINSTEDQLEIRRALVIKMLTAGIKSKKIEKAFGLSQQTVSRLKVDFAMKGLEALKNGHLTK